MKYNIIKLSLKSKIKLKWNISFKLNKLKNYRIDETVLKIFIYFLQAQNSLLIYKLSL